MEHDIAHMRLTIWLTIATLCVVIVFAAFPFVDLDVSALFFNRQTGEWIGRGESFSFWRNILRFGGEAFAIITFLMFLGNLIIGKDQKTGWRVWAFIWGTTLACAGLLVNGILKAWLGRARPDNVTEFGGANLFTPPFQLSDQCAANCSFSSGEAALVACVVLPFCVLIWPQLSRNGKIVCGIVAGVLIGVTSTLRMAAGRHFLSDATMSILFAALTALVLYRLLEIARHRQVFTARLIVSDLVVILNRCCVHGFRLLKTVARYTAKAALRLWSRIKAKLASQRRSDPPEPVR